MFCSDAQILTDVAAALKQASSAALVAKGAWWPQAVVLPHLTAYNRIVSVLASRAYSARQIAAWDRGAEFERVFAVYWSLVENGVLSQAGAGFIEKYERFEKELDTVTVTANGIVTIPEGPIGTSHSGQMNQGNSLFSFPDPDDPRIGRTTRF